VGCLSFSKEEFCRLLCGSGVEVVWMCFHVFVMWGVVPSDYSVVSFYYCVAVFL